MMLRRVLVLPTSPAAILIVRRLPLRADQAEHRKNRDHAEEITRGEPEWMDFCFQGNRDAQDRNGERHDHNGYNGIPRYPIDGGLSQNGGHHDLQDSDDMPAQIIEPT